jgi:hypothetical protein
MTSLSIPGYCAAAGRTAHQPHLTGLFALLVWSVGSASAQPTRFDIAGDASFAADAPVQADGRFALKAQLVVPASAVSALTTQTNDRFTVSALLSPSSLVCYNDTIFRDSFDGTGL